jgi:hypothetical protein
LFEQYIKALELVESEDVINAHISLGTRDFAWISLPSAYALKCSSIIIETEEADEDAIAIGESKIGGMPHVPEGFVWPLRVGAPLGFIAQINLSEVAPYDLDNALSHEGTNVKMPLNTNILRFHKMAGIPEGASPSCLSFRGVPSWEAAPCILCP